MAIIDFAFKLLFIAIAMIVMFIYPYLLFMMPIFWLLNWMNRPHIETEEEKANRLFIEKIVKEHKAKKKEQLIPFLINFLSFGCVVPPQNKTVIRAKRKTRMAQPILPDLSCR